MDIVVVGASLGGVRVVEALRAAGCDDRVVLVGDEEHPPYDRPPLSKEILTGKLGADDLALRPDLADLGVELMLGRAVTSVDPSSRELIFGDRERIRYDQLVIATGARARQPATLKGLSGVVVLRTIDDATAIRDAMECGADVAVIGGGFIGSEVASAARDRGLTTTVFEAMPAPMCRVFGPTLGDRFAALHHENGSRLRCGAAVTGLLGRDRVEGLQLADGSMTQADLVVVGVGSVPNVEWLRDLDLDLTDGVLCDERGRVVGAERMHAVGDVARWPSARFGGAIRTEHWTAAGDHAQAVAADLIGQPIPPETLPYVWSDQFGRRIQIVGRCQPDDSVHIVREDDAGFVAITGRDDRLSAVVAMNDPKRFGALRRLLVRDASWSDALAAARA